MLKALLADASHHVARAKDSRAPAASAAIRAPVTRFFSTTGIRRNPPALQVLRRGGEVLGAGRSAGGAGCGPYLGGGTRAARVCGSEAVPGFRRLSQLLFHAETVPPRSHL